MSILLILYLVHTGAMTVPAGWILGGAVVVEETYIKSEGKR
jgi:hypothetical protein